MSEPDKYGWYIGDDLKWKHKPTQDKFIRTPNWPHADDPTMAPEACQTIKVSVKISCYGKGVTRKQAERLALDYEKVARRRFGRKDGLEVSAII